MPKASSFLGVDAPTDRYKWRAAQVMASSGKLILLEKVLSKVKSHVDVVDSDIHCKWLHRIMDVFIEKTEDFEKVSSFLDANRSPIAMLGKYKFTDGISSGNYVGYEGYGPNQVSTVFKKKQVKLRKSFVAVGLTNENWGWASTLFTNRTCTWASGYNENDKFRNSNFQTDELDAFLNDPSLLMLVVNQHHNVSHHKVVSLPLGVSSSAAENIMITGATYTADKTMKDNLLLSIGSSWGTRPDIVDCVRGKMGDLLVVPKKVDRSLYIAMLLKSRSVLCLPGLGYDTYRLWEVLLSGSMPILERGVGLDRTLYKLPALLVDDYSEVTPLMVRTAYIEAIYHADEWEYERLTRKFWENVIKSVAAASSTDEMMRILPDRGIDYNFARPMIPYTCGRIGGCDYNKTKRVPENSCAIDYDFPMDRYNWDWWLPEVRVPLSAYLK